MPDFTLEQFIQKYIRNVLPNATEDVKGNIFRKELLRAAEGNELAKAKVVFLQDLWRVQFDSLPELARPDASVRPDIGMLKSCGYFAGGADGIGTPARRLVLDYILRANILPPVSDKSYMREWHQPLSQDRFQKLQRVLAKLALDKWNDPSNEVAVSRWFADHEYVAASEQQIIKIGQSQSR